MRPEMDASVSTRVVSWNDAAEMNESVESDAFVIPSSSGRPGAGRPPAVITRALPFLHVHVDTARQRVLPRLRARLVRDDDDLPLPFDDAAVLDDAVDLADDRRLAGFSRFEQLHHARQTARDVLGLRRLARDL